MERGRRGKSSAEGFTKFQFRLLMFDSPIATKVIKWLNGVGGKVRLSALNDPMDRREQHLEETYDIWKLKGGPITHALTHMHADRHTH